MGGQGSGRLKNPPKPKKMLKEILPVDLIFDADELPMYQDLVDVYIADFDLDDLTSSDMDDIMDLAKNRVLEFRLLKSAKGNSAKHLDVAASIEKLSRKNEKIKESLSTRRKDRINPNEFKGFSIVDLALAFDNEKQDAMKERMRKLKAEEAEIIKQREKEDYEGNSLDADTKRTTEEPHS